MRRSKRTRRLGWCARGIGFVAALSVIQGPAFAQKQSVPERIHKLPPGGPAPRTPTGTPTFPEFGFQTARDKR